MAVSGSKRLVPPWFQKCILYLGTKATLNYTSFTIRDDNSRKNGQKGRHFLLIKRLGKKMRKPWNDGYVPYAPCYS
jgi:hypothetical protein